MKKDIKIKLYRKRTLQWKILKYNKNFIKKKTEFFINYFYWFYNKMYEYKVIGVCFKKKKKYIYNIISFYIFYIIKNIKINQLYFVNSPFLCFLKYNVLKKRKKNIKNIYIL